MSKTTLLPPASAVRIAWARTGAFPKEVHSNRAAASTEDSLKAINEQAGKNKEEKEYIVRALAAMDACQRSLDTAYKGRELNFQENEKLRLAYLDSIKENLDFGNKAKNFLKSLPTMSITTAGGVVTVGQLVKLSNGEQWALGVVLAGIGYLVNLGIVKLMRKQSQMLYVEQDYDRTLYYDQYVNRSSVILYSLYLELDRVHKHVFGKGYPVATDVNTVIDDILRGVKSTLCTYVHKHMSEKKITPKLWALCETGIEEVTTACPFWGK